MSVFGHRVLRTEDPRLLRGEGLYVDDVPLPGALHAVFVRSPFAHALVNGIDASTVPDGVQVFTAADVDVAPSLPRFGSARKDMPRPRLAGDRVRFVGEAVAVCVAEARAEAVDAAELVFVDYEPLPVVVDPEDALRGEVLLFPEHGTNVCAEWTGEEDESLFDRCELVVRGRLHSRRLAPAPLEPRAAAAEWRDGRLTAWLSTQWPHGDKEHLAEMLGLEEEQVRVIAPEVGGGFGAKIFGGPESVVVAWLARRLERPVRWVETRRESMLALGQGRGMILDFELGGSRDGRLDAYRLRVLQDSGAYPEVGAALPMLTKLMQTGVYAIPRVEFHGRSVLTNTTPTVAYRGAGRPEATQAIERAVDLFAAEAGLDPADVRRRNLIPPEAFPFESPGGANYDSGEYARALDGLLGEVDYERLRAEQRARRERGDVRQLGIGISVYVEVTNGGGSSEWGEVEITREGGAIVRSGLSPHGQGHGTGLATLASAQLGIPLEKIEVIFGDTDAVPRGGGTAGSRSLQSGGVAVDAAATEVVELGRRRAAELLEAAEADLVLDVARGAFHVAGSPEPSVEWAELAAVEELRAAVDFEPADATYPFGAHLAVVEVDTETGKVELLRLVAVDDAGRLLNPLLAEGQRHGGIAQGASQALLEEFVYDDDGNPLTLTFADYPFPSAAELPPFELVPLETPTPVNPLGAKGIGESGTIGATPAVLNAVIDALAPYGVRELDMPATPERVWRAIQG